MREETQPKRVEYPCSGTGRHTSWMGGNPTFQALENPQSENQLPPFSREIDYHPHYKNPQTSRYALPKIIMIKAFIHSLIFS